MPADSPTVVLVYPDVLGTYGDRGNAAALVHRARARGMRCRVLRVGVRDPLPVDADIYLIGGGEDSAVVAAAARLRHSHALDRAARNGAAIFGVCAGFQMLSAEFSGPDGVRHDGAGLLDVTCGRLEGPRAVGEVLCESAESLDMGFLTGFENHQGDARLGPDARPLGLLVRGVGNGDGRTEGAMQGRVIGTYLHGPALVRNDGLADHLLQLVCGPLPQLDDELVQQLRRERRASALSGHDRPRLGWGRRAGRLVRHLGHQR